MDSYRVEVDAGIEIALADADAGIEPVPTGMAGRGPERHIDQLSGVICDFNERFGGIEFRDQDRLTRFLFEELPQKLGANDRVQNAS